MFVQLFLYRTSDISREESARARNSGAAVCVRVAIHTRDNKRRLCENERDDALSASSWLSQLVAHNRRALNFLFVPFPLLIAGLVFGRIIAIR